MHALLHFFRIEEGGQGLVEYALILLFVALVAIVGLKTFGSGVGNSLTATGARLP